MPVETYSVTLSFRKYDVKFFCRGVPEINGGVMISQEITSSGNIMRRRTKLTHVSSFTITKEDISDEPISA